MGLEYKKMETSFSNAMVLDVEPTEADLILLDAKPWLLMDLSLGDLTTGLSFALANITHYAPCNEGIVVGNLVNDVITASTYTIDGYTNECRTLYNNVNYGINNLLYLQDVDGKITARMPVGEIAVDGSGKHINFGIIVGEEATIQYVCTGLLEDLDVNGIGLGTYTQRTEKRIIEYGGGNTTKYSIGGVVQPYIPALPELNQLILDNTALIGHPDEITSINSDTEMFQYYSIFGALIT